ncbi:MAG: GNAT family N-acetyltransferase [Trueperaceae bacterium]
MKALSKLLNQKGQITRWPSQPKERTLVLEFLASKFSSSTRYSERDVNEILKTWHTFSDWAMLRRELFDCGFLGRDRNGSSYWRTEKSLEVFDESVTVIPRRSTVQLFKLEGYGVRILTLQDKEKLQSLFTHCEDYHLLSEGERLQGHEGEKALEGRPPKQPVSDMYKIGVFNSENLIAFIDIAKHYPEQESWHIGLFLIDQGLRSQGIGHKVLRGLEGWLTEQGAKKIMLSVLEENQAALRFWQREGFTHTNILPPVTYGKKTHVRLEFVKNLLST